MVSSDVNFPFISRLYKSIPSAATEEARSKDAWEVDMSQQCIHLSAASCSLGSWLGEPVLLYGPHAHLLVSSTPEATGKGQEGRGTVRSNSRATQGDGSSCRSLSSSCVGETMSRQDPCHEMEMDPHKTPFDEDRQLLSAAYRSAANFPGLPTTPAENHGRRSPRR